MIVSQWCKLFEKMEASPQEFYRSVEEALQQRQIPALAVSRVDWHEGGLLSAKREYLRLTRERLVFDICAAPFGSGFFISSRLVEERLKISLVAVMGLLAIVLFAIYFFYQQFGFFLGMILFLVCLLLLSWFLRSAVSRGLADVDATLLKIPGFGPLYERFFRAQTYYRADVTMMFQQAVHASVMQAIDQVTQSKGIRLLTDDERKPILAELFRK